MKNILVTNNKLDAQACTKAVTSESTGGIEVSLDKTDLDALSLNFGKAFAGRRQFREQLSGVNLPQVATIPTLGVSPQNMVAQALAAKGAKEFNLSPQAAMEEVQKRLLQIAQETNKEQKEADREITFQALERIKVAAELAKLGEVLTNNQIGGRRNIVINGAQQIAQRTTSASSITSSFSSDVCAMP